MTASRQRRPPVPRAIAAATADALTAASSEDAVALQQAAQRLAALDREQVGLVLGAVVRSLLEESHPGGLTGEGVQELLAQCATTSAAWFPAVDEDVLLVLLAGSLGIHADEEPHPVSSLEMSSHAPLLISALLGSSPSDRLTTHLDAAFAEIARSETVESP
jgi:hypothetical protein